MSLNPWIDYLKLPALNEHLIQAGYSMEERITPRAICNDMVYTRFAFIMTTSGELLWHPQNLISELNVVLEYWRTHSTGELKREMFDWDSQLHGRVAEFEGIELVHLYTSSGNRKLIKSAVQKLLEYRRIREKAIILNEPGVVLGTAKGIQ